MQRFFAGRSRIASCRVDRSTKSPWLHYLVRSPLMNVALICGGSARFGHRHESFEMRVWRCRTDEDKIWTFFLSALHPRCRACTSPQSCHYEISHDFISLRHFSFGNFEIDMRPRASLRVPVLLLFYLPQNMMWTTLWLHKLSSGNWFYAGKKLVTKQVTSPGCYLYGYVWNENSSEHDHWQLWKRAWKDILWLLFCWEMFVFRAMKHIKEL